MQTNFASKTFFSCPDLQLQTSTKFPTIPHKRTEKLPTDDSILTLISSQLPQSCNIQVRMATKVNIKTSFEAAKTIEPIYTGGDICSNSKGTLLATCVDEDVYVVDTKTAAPLCRIEGDGEAITSLSISPNGSHLVICSRSLSMRIYALSNDGSSQLQSELLRTLKPHNTPVVTSAIDGTGSLLATGGSDGTIKVWDLRAGYASHTFHAHGGVVSALHFFEREFKTAVDSTKQIRKAGITENAKSTPTTNNAVCLASGGEDGQIKIWDLRNRKAIKTLDSHVSVVRCLQYSPQQQLLLSASRDKTMILWDLQSWKPQKIVPALEVLEAAGFISEGSYFYSGGENGAVRIWQTATGHEITQKQKPSLETDAITQAIPMPEDKILLSIRQDQTIKFHSFGILENLNAENSIEPLPITRTVSGNHDEIIDMACVGSDRSLLAIATNTESIRLISVANIASADSVNVDTLGKGFGSNTALLEGHEDIIICLDVDWSGSWLATGAKDNTARLWRLDPSTSSFDCVAVFAGHAESLGAVALPRGPPTSSSAAKNPLQHPPSFLLTGSQDKTIKRWDTSKLSYSSTMKLPHTGMKAVFTRVAHEKDINALDVSPVAPLFASASQDRTIKIWSLEDGSVTGILRGHKRGVWSIRFSPANTPALNLSEGGSSGSRGLLVSGSGDRTLKVWSLSTYTCLLTFEGHSNSVLKVIWLPPPPTGSEAEGVAPTRQNSTNQPLIASASADTLVKLWTPYSPNDSDHLLTTLDNHSDRVWALASPRFFDSAAHSQNTCQFPLISGAADASLTFWRDVTTQTASLASQKATERIEQDQLLQNHIHAKNYREVIVLSLALNHPGRLLKVFEDVVNLPDEEKDGSSVMGVRAVDEVIANLDHEQIFSLMQRVRDWNTNARTAPVAQRVLNCLLKSYPSSTFTEMAKDRTIGVAGKGMKELLRALEVYTDRHYKRMEDLMDESFLLEYTLREMDEISGATAISDAPYVNGKEVSHANGDVIMI